MKRTAVQVAARWSRVERLALIGPYPYDRNPVGGVESANRALVELLLAAHPGLEISVLTNGDGERTSTHDGRATIAAELPGDYRWARLRGFPHERNVIRKFVAALEPGTVVQSSGTVALHAVESARRHRLPSVVTIHGVLERDIVFETHLGAAERWLLARLARTRFGKAVRAADLVIAISTYSAEYARSVGRSGTIDVIPNPLDSRFEGLVHVHRPEGHVLLMAASLQPRKGLGTVVEAVHLAARSVPTLTLAIAGPVVDPGYVQSVRSRIHDLGMVNRIEWLGQLSKPGVIDAMMHSDLMVLASGEENLPQVLQEAGSIGLPFVSTSVGGIRDLVPSEQVNTILFEHGDVRALATRIETLLTNHLARRQTAAALRRHILLNFSNSSIAERTLDAYAAIVAPSTDERPPTAQ